MAENSHIQWTDHTFNPWIGCTKVSPGCAHCYAETLDRNRYSKTLRGDSPTPVSHWGPGAPRHRTSASNWKQPLKWNRQATESVEDALHDFGADRYVAPQRPRVFCASLADWLDEEVPIEWLADLLKLIHDTPNLDWLLLSKRPQNWAARMEAVSEKCTGDGAAFARLWRVGTPPANVWIGATVEDQKRADERIPALLQIPAKVRFLSCEPLLEAVDLRKQGWLLTVHESTTREEPTEVDTDPGGIHWAICGGESGKGARPFDLRWARSLRDQCQAAMVSFFMKQLGDDPVESTHTWDTKDGGCEVRTERHLFIGTKHSRGGGELADIPEDLRIRQFPGGSACAETVEPSVAISTDPGKGAVPPSADGKL